MLFEPSGSFIVLGDEVIRNNLHAKCSILFAFLVSFRRCKTVFGLCGARKILCFSNERRWPRSLV